jgi:hypothetical protein
MSVQRFWIAPLLLVFSLSVLAAAQDNVVTGIIGRTFVSDQGIKGATFPDPTVHFGNGLTFEGTYGRHLLGNGNLRLWGEIPVVFNPDQDLITGANVIPGSYKALFITPGVRLNLFATTAIQPWFAFGGGYARFSASSQLVYGGPNPGKTGTNTSAIDGGFGLDVRFKPKWGLRGQVRDFYTGVPNLNVDTGKSRQHNYFVGGGVVYFFGK